VQTTPNEEKEGGILRNGKIKDKIKRFARSCLVEEEVIFGGRKEIGAARGSEEM
jgi:hypothetical protein